MNGPVNTPSTPASEEKRVSKVVKGSVTTKKNDMRKLADIFISEDVGNVKNYILMDVLVPAIKKAIFDIVTNGIDMFLYGSTGRTKSPGTSGSKVSYRNFYEQKNAPSSGQRVAENNHRDNGLDYEDILFDNRGDAEAVKQQLQAAVATYGLVTIGDLYDMVDLPCPYTNNKYGWMDMSSAEVYRFRGSYRLKLPKAVPLDY